MKTRSAFLGIAVLAFILASCGGGKQGKINTPADLKGKVIGTISTGVSDKSKFDQTTAYIGAEPKEILPFNKRSDLLAAVLSGKIDAFHAPKIVAEFYAKRNDNLKIIEPKDPFEAEIVMAVRIDDVKLKSDLDSAITVLQGNGTMKVLEDKWITNLPASNEPAFEATPKIGNAKTIYVGVSGDFAPLDYIAADGRPAGFNVALLAEIGKMLNVNFEVVSIESQAKFAALFSKKIDAVFFQMYGNQFKHLYPDMKSKFLATIPYYKGQSGYFLVKK